ncbi:MAG: response regulator [Longimicrobiales bacterium]
MQDAPIILLVEDDPLLRDAFRLLLEDAGYIVREAGTAAAALDAVEDATPALVLLDLGLPDRPGLDVARTLRGRDSTRQTPIIALTGRAGAAEERASLEAGCTHFFSKPLEPRVLLEALPAFLADRP